MDFCLPSNRESLPDNAKAGFDMLMKQLKETPGASYIEDIKKSSQAIYYSFATSIIYSFVFIYLMSAFAEPIAWICIVLAQVGFVCGAVFGWMFRAEEKVRSDANWSAWTEEERKSSQNTQNLMLLVSIVFAVVSLAFMCCVVCGFRSLKLAIDVIDAAADFLAETKRIIIVPVLYFLLIIIAIGIWFGGFVGVYSVGTITANEGVIPQSRSVKFEDKRITYFLWFMVFGLFWVVAWLRYTSNYICMVAASTYYFNSGPNKEGQAEVGLGFVFAHLKNTGSIAFGAAILAAIQLIRLIFVYVAQKAAKASGDNSFVKFIIACGNCYLGCLEKICDYLNSAAFAYMAVSGNSFLSSAWSGFLLNVKHILKFSFANFIAKIFILLGKIGITVGNCVSFYFVLKLTKEEVGSLVGPLLVVGSVSFITASLFLALFDTAVMALMTCLAVDIDLHGSPQHGPPTFHDGIKKVHDNHAAVMEAGNEIM